MPDISTDICTRVQAAYKSGTALNITGAGTKSFLGLAPEDAERLDVTAHHGIVEYDPAELVLVARAGTTLKTIEELLSEHQQMLGFEPPFVDSGATLGGAVAAGLAGPRRAYTGSVRDFILGAKFVNGKGEIVTAGGKVMKNVAGFDLFRPMARSMGTLGVLLQVSLRLLPKPEYEKTILHEEGNETAALKKMSLWAAKTQSISAAAWDGHNIRIRLSGSAASIDHGREFIEGETCNDTDYWHDLNNFKLDFFKQNGRLWRVSVAPMSATLAGNLRQIIDWGGAQRWLMSDQPAEDIRLAASKLGGHAECFSNDAGVATYHPLESKLLALSQRFKAAFDPAGILNPGRIYPQL